MQPALHITTKVLPGHRLEIGVPEVAVGETVEVIIISRPGEHRTSALELLEGMPAQRLFKTAEEADDYLRVERESWDP